MYHQLLEESHCTTLLTFSCILQFTVMSLISQVVDDCYEMPQYLRTFVTYSYIQNLDWIYVITN